MVSEKLIYEIIKEYGEIDTPNEKAQFLKDIFEFCSRMMNTLNKKHNVQFAEVVITDEEVANV